MFDLHNAAEADSGHASQEERPVSDMESPEHEFDIVDEASIESFPASDPPGMDLAGLKKSKSDDCLDRVLRVPSS